MIFLLGQFYISTLGINCRFFLFFPQFFVRSFPLVNDRVREALGDTFYEEFMVSSFHSTSVVTTVNLLSQKTDYTIQFLYFVLAEKRIAVKLKETPENNTL